jgi:cytoskeleton protein RodZ
MEKAPAAGDPVQSLGTFLIAARERRGFAAADVVRETRLPAHYLRMMESNDYSKISDRLYLVPFLRRYASFLDLDQEDVAMRFVREVQRADSTPPARLDQPLMAEPRKHQGWTGAILVIGFLAVAAGVYVYESDRHRQATPNNLAPQASATAVTGADSAATSIVPQVPASP